MMNPLTPVKRMEIIVKEAALGISEDVSWHAKYKNSAYIFVGGIPFDLTEGDLLAIFAHKEITEDWNSKTRWTEFSKFAEWIQEKCC